MLAGDDDASVHWRSNPDVVRIGDDEKTVIKVHDSNNRVVGVTDYENHHGALLVIDECQSFFRPRPAGSPVPDHVAALEVHRHQGLDIWLITQRPGLIDSNVRGLCGRHIALRSTALGRYKYEWPECGDIDSKMSRDVAARTRFKLPKSVFGLYKSAEVHTAHGHSLSIVAKSLFVIIPLIVFFLYKSYALISDKFSPKIIPAAVEVQPSAPAGKSPGGKALVVESEMVTDWQIVGHYFREQNLIVVLRNSSGLFRDLVNPDHFKFSFNGSSADLPEGGRVSTWTNLNIQHLAAK